MGRGEDGVGGGGIGERERGGGEGERKGWRDNTTTHISISTLSLPPSSLLPPLLPISFLPNPTHFFPSLSLILYVFGHGRGVA